MAISKETCSEYTELGLQLGLEYNDIQNALSTAKNNSLHLKTFCILQEWKKRAGNDFTFTVLARALENENVGLATVAQKFCYEHVVCAVEE